jgi:hypothetical protein
MFGKLIGSKGHDYCRALLMGPAGECQGQVFGALRQAMLRQQRTCGGYYRAGSFFIE